MYNGGDGGAAGGHILHPVCKILPHSAGGFILKGYSIVAAGVGWGGERLLASM